MKVNKSRNNLSLAINIWRNNYPRTLINRGTIYRSLLIFGATIIHRERIFDTRTIRSCVSAAECVGLSRDNCLNKPRENNPGSNNIWRNNLSITLNIWRNNFPWTLINRWTIFREIFSTIKLTVIRKHTSPDKFGGNTTWLTNTLPVSTTDTRRLKKDRHLIFS